MCKNLLFQVIQKRTIPEEVSKKCSVKIKMKTYKQDTRKYARSFTNSNRHVPFGIWDNIAADSI